MQVKKGIRGLRQINKDSEGVRIASSDRQMGSEQVWGLKKDNISFTRGI